MSYSYTTPTRDCRGSPLDRVSDDSILGTWDRDSKFVAVLVAFPVRHVVLVAVELVSF